MIESSKHATEVVSREGRNFMDSCASSQCTQLTVHSRFAIVLTDKLYTQVPEILIDLCVTGSYHVHAFTAMIMFHKYAVLSLIYACFMEAIALSCTVDFLPQ